VAGQRGDPRVVDAVFGALAECVTPWPLPRNSRPFSSVYCLCFWLGLFAGDGVVVNA